MPPNGTNLAITNPLVLYRSLIATNQIQSDPAQHRLALHLQKLYDRLIDYEPSIEYADRLRKLTRTVNANQDDSLPPLEKGVLGTRGIWTSLLAQKEKRDSLALTRTLSSHEAAMALQSPKGLMLHGEVGTGKSMLIDLFADSLPNRKKRRWHFNTFMLETFSRLELLRKSRARASTGGNLDEYSLLWLARDLIEKSPILFLDEFQLPDRAASKILSNLMTIFFQLGGVLVATSNRMPEELAKAAGLEFTRPVSGLRRLGWRLGMSGVVGRDDGPGQKGEFAQFLEVLRARCEVWEMEDKKDYRRLRSDDGSTQSTSSKRTGASNMPHGIPPTQASTVGIDGTYSDPSEPSGPKYYLINSNPTAPSPPLLTSVAALDGILHTLTSTPSSEPLPWAPANLTVYGRHLHIPAQYTGTAFFNFDQLCGEPLGPADYITLASTYHTLVISEVPVMTFLQKNEARRFITLLDAMYEARCRLLVTADAGPDDILFPMAHPDSISTSTQQEVVDDAVHPETYSEIHQDLTSPFRPNISSYTPEPSLPIDALEDDPPNRVRRPGSSFTDERKLGSDGGKTPNFADIVGLTGEDERFAVKRAQSRLWEMCSKRWWDRASSPRDGVEDGDGWWRPLPVELRHWERSTPTPIDTSGDGSCEVKSNQPSARPLDGNNPGTGDQTGTFAHGASPFRTANDAPPKIDPTHMWGTVKWGRRAGPWGKGVEGLEERRKEKNRGKNDRDER